jgi:mitochondrial inner membrane protein COX18
MAKMSLFYLSPRRLQSSPCGIHFHRPVSLNSQSRVQLLRPNRRLLHTSQSILESTLQVTHDLIWGLHTVTGAPWYLTIPLVAVGVNVVFRLRWTYQARKIAQKRTQLHPLIFAWSHKHRRDVLENEKLPNIGDQSKLVHIEKEIQTRTSKTAKSLYREFGLQTWKIVLPQLLAFPAWLVVIETLRRMSGGPTGLLGLFSSKSSMEGLSNADLGAPSDIEVTNATIHKPRNLTAEEPTSSTPDTLTEVSSDIEQSARSLYEPTFATDGCLWFQDLTAADPYHVLPFAVSAALAYSVLSTPRGRAALWRTPEMRRDDGIIVRVRPESLGYTVLQRTLVILALSLGFITSHFPAAIHLYWLSSTVVSLLVQRIIQIQLPVTKTVMEGTGDKDPPWLTKAHRSSK